MCHRHITPTTIFFAVPLIKYSSRDIFLPSLVIFSATFVRIPDRLRNGCSHCLTFLGYWEIRKPELRGQQFTIAVMCSIEMQLSAFQLFDGILMTCRWNPNKESCTALIERAHMERTCSTLATHAFHISFPHFLSALVKQATIPMPLCDESHLLWLRQVKQQFKRRSKRVR